MGLYKWLRGTRENLFGIGDGLDTNKGIEATIPGATKPTIRYNITTDKWELSQDGVTYVEIGYLPHDAKYVIIPDGIGTPTYDDLQDFLNMTSSAGRLTGGVITAHDAGVDAKLNISELEGMIFTDTTLGSTIIYFKKAAQDEITPTGLTDLAVNWIYMDYDGGALTYKATVTRSNINDYSMFVIGRVWVNGNNIEIQETGYSIYNRDRRAHNRLILKYGGMEWISGGILSAHGTALRLACDAGSWYVANYAYATDAADTFYVWYKTGGGAWTKSAELSLFSAIFDGGSSTVFECYQDGTSLGALNSKYGVYWVFLCPEGDLYVVLGDATYANIGAAQAATIPASLPPYCVNWASLIGRVICYDGAAAFYSVESALTMPFTLSAVVDHGSLAGLADDDHTQYVLADGTRAINELYLTPKVSSTGAEGTMFYDSDDDHVWVATE